METDKVIALFINPKLRNNVHVSAKGPDTGLVIETIHHLCLAFHGDLGEN